MTRRACPFLIQPALERRPGNALNIEIGTPLPRCRLSLPEEWSGRGGGRDLAFRWLASGGNAFVFGPCVPDTRPCANCGDAACVHDASGCRANGPAAGCPKKCPGFVP